MNLSEYRKHPREQERIGDLEALVPDGHGTLLDVGTRDGYIAGRLASRFRAVTALDLVQPEVRGSNVTCVAGDITRLPFGDGAFDVVLCAEVLEHIPSDRLSQACAELIRVARHQVIVGVPYRQDLRVGRLTCRHCGAVNPAWGHVNSFDERRLDALFPGMVLIRRSYVGEPGSRTNALAAWLFDRGGNPWGTYGQEEPCSVCGSRMDRAPDRNTSDRLFSKAAHLAGEFWRAAPGRSFWIHSVYARQETARVMERKLVAG